MATRTTIASGLYSSAGTWTGGLLPGVGDDAVIALGHAVTQTDNRAALTMTVNGRLIRSRAASHTLALSGNLVANGIYDSGLQSDRIPANVNVITTFALIEANYVGGGMAVLATDVGVWTPDGGQFFSHGAIKDAWTKLAAQASVAATSITVQGYYTEGWAIGDIITIGDTHYPIAGFNHPEQEQSERRIITGITGVPGDATRVITFTGGLSFLHHYILQTFNTRFGDTYIRPLTAAVQNLSANVIFDTADGTNANAPHFMVMGTGKFYMNDTRFNNFSPRSRVNPMGRYVIHAHRQEDGSRGSYADRIKIENAKGGVLFNHESWGIKYADWAMYNVARELPFAADQLTTPVFLEDTQGIYPPHVRHGADDCRFDRFSVMKWGVTQNSITQDRNAAFWLGFGSSNALVAGADVTGGTSGFDSGAFVWPEGASGLVPVMRSEAYANDQNGTFAHINTTPDPSAGGQQHIVDLMVWRNFMHGIRDGAYITGLHYFFVWMVGNAQLATGTGGPIEVGGAMHSVTLRRVTNFLIDGENGANANGVRVNPYVVDSTLPEIQSLLPGGSDSTYEDGVIQNLAAGRFDVIHGQSGGQNPIGSAISHVAFNRVSFSGRGIRFGNGAGGPSVGSPPFGSYLRFRGQTGLAGKPANFTMYNIGDPLGAGGVTDGNALRVDSDTSGNGLLCPRAHLTISVGDEGLEPAPDSQGRRLITATCATRDGTAFARPDAERVVFFIDKNTIIATQTVQDGAGNFTVQFDISTHPYRRGYIHAEAYYDTGGNAGKFNCSNVLRFRRSITATAQEPVAPTLSAFVATSPTSVQWSNTVDPNAIGYEYETSPNGVSGFVVRASGGQNSATATWLGAVASTTYHGRVSAIGPSGTRYPSNVVGPVTTPASAPVAPSGLQFASVTATTLSLTFLDNSPDETLWRYRYRTPPISGVYGAVVDTATGTGPGSGTTVTIPVTGLIAGLQYEFEVWAANGTGDSPRISGTVTTLPATPAAPSNLVAGTATDVTMPLSWLDNATNETAYEAEFKRSVDSTWTVFSSALPPGTQAVVVTGLTAATSYDFRVRARNISITSAYSNIVTRNTANPPAPNAPSNLQHGTPATTSMPLTWLDNAADEDFYHVEYKLTSEPTTWTVFSSSLPPNTVAATVTGLTANLSYDFRVRCANAGGGNSSYSNIVTITTAAVSPPATPTTLATGAPGLTTMPLTWVDVATTEDFYHVEFRRQGDSIWTVFTTSLAPNTQSATVTGLASGTPYEFRVRCALAGVNSAYSNTATGTTGQPDPGTPTLSSVTSTIPTQIDAVWTNVANESGYDLETSPTGAGTWTARQAFAADTPSGSWFTATPGTAYDVRIVAFRGAIRVPSNVINVTTPASAPNAPTTPTFSNRTSSSVTFTVTDASAAETGFEARYRDETNPASPGAYVALTPAAAVGGTGSLISWNVTGLAAGRTYRFGARAIDAVGASAYVEAFVTTVANLPPPPTGMGASGPHGGMKRSSVSDTMDRYRGKWSRR